jgi:hypothetical protein
MRRWVFVLVVSGVVLWGAPPASASTDRSIAVHLLGLYDSPTSPSEHASRFTDGFGFQFFPELQVNPFLGFGTGFTTEYFYRPGGPAMRVGTFDLSASLRLPSRSGKAQPYARVELGFNAMPKAGNHWRGSRRVSWMLGTRLPMGFGLGFDLGVRQELLLPKPNDLQSISVQWGIVSEFDLKHGRSKAASGPKASDTLTPWPSPTSTSTATPSMTATTSFKTPQSTPTSIPENQLTETESPTPVERRENTRSTHSSAAFSRVVPTSTPEASTPPLEASARMLDLYEKGIEAYKANRFESGILYLKAALEIKDAKVEYWYYAEANAMLGVLYHYHKTSVGHLETARKYYRAALKIDRDTATAQKGLKALDAIPGGGKSTP